MLVWMEFEASPLTADGADNPRERFEPMSQSMTLRGRLLALLLCLAAATAYSQKKSWVDYGGGPDNSHFVESKQITKANVGQLEVAWAYPYGQTGFNPIVVDKMMYVIGRSVYSGG